MFDSLVLKGLSKPQNDEEFAVLTEWLIGTPLHLDTLRFHIYTEPVPYHTKKDICTKTRQSKLNPRGVCTYKILEKFDDCFSDLQRLRDKFLERVNLDIFEYHKSNLALFDLNDILMKHCFGEINCGGIASKAYGQTDVYGYREIKRLKNWVVSRRLKKTRNLRKPFTRLAHKLIGVGENK